jgi:CSLREA domain-containing protein
MNKTLRLSIPFILASLCLGMVIYLAKESSQASAAPSGIEEALLVTTLEDELNTDGDCSLREAISRQYQPACGRCGEASPTPSPSM